jgi:hypothetical protein
MAEGGGEEMMGDKGGYFIVYKKGDKKESVYGMTLVDACNALLSVGYGITVTQVMYASNIEPPEGKK